MDNRLIIWGCGYLGFSNLVYYGHAGFHCIGIDSNSAIIGRVLSGDYKPDLQAWMNEPYMDLFHSGQVQITDSWESVTSQENDVHFICVPTEANGELSLVAIWDVVNKIIAMRKGFSSIRLLIESTLPYGTAERVLKRVSDSSNHNIMFCVSPRRDWFTEAGKTLRTLTRVYGCNTVEASCFFQKILASVCESLVLAENYQYAEFSKSVENTIRHIGIIFANQLSDAFPDIDTRKVLALAGTKWNINTYYPSFGPGGYCIPLSSKYVLHAAGDRPFPILQEVTSYTAKRPESVAEQIHSKLHKSASILILGIAYMADVAVDKESPILQIIPFLRDRGYKLSVHDPNFTRSYLQIRTGCNNIVEDLSHTEFWKQFDAVILSTGHSSYSNLPIQPFFHTKDGMQVFDNTGLWQSYASILNKNGKYRLIGTASWQEE